MDIRIVAEFKDHRTSKRFIFYPNWIVDCSKFKQYRTERFEWLEKTVVREWYPLLLRGEEETHIHLILEGDRWDHKESGEISLSLEIATSAKKWKKYRNYLLHFNDDIFESKCCYTAYNPEVEELRKL